MSEAVAPEMLDWMSLTDPSQVEALSSSIRFRILLEAQDPVTVGDLADRFDVPKTRLYYHVNLLVEEGLLVQVDERMSGARVERIYRAAARTFRTGPGLFDGFSDPREAARLAAGLALNPARPESEAVFEKRARGEPTVGDVRRMLVRLTDKQAREFAKRLDRLCSELGALEDALPANSAPESYAFSFVFAPAGLGGES